jgi:hypothetical protein
MMLLIRPASMSRTACVSESRIVWKALVTASSSGFCASQPKTGPVPRPASLGHQQREEQGVLGEDVGGKSGVGPGVSGRVPVAHLREDDDLFVGALGLGCARRA